MLNYQIRQNGSHFSQLSYESRKKLNLVKLFLFLTILFLGFTGYYFQLIPLKYHELMGYFLVMSISCNLVPLPTYVLVIYVSHDYPLWLIVATGAVGATISAMIEYLIIDFLMDFDRFARLKQNGKYKKYARYFDRFSFGSIFLTSVIPLPVDVIRLMAITRRYVKWKYLLATFVGRIPRIFIFAFLGSQLAYSKLIAIILLAATLIFELIRRLIKIYQRVPATERSI